MALRVYEIPFAELGISAKFKVLSPQEVEIFVADSISLDTDDYMKKVLETLVFNMKTEVLDVIQNMSPESGTKALQALFNACVMLNPGLDVNQWLEISYAYQPRHIEDVKPSTDIVTVPKPPYPDVPTEIKTDKPKPRKMSKAKFLNLDKYLKERVVGQDHAIEAVKSALKLSQAGLNDDRRPLGVFMFAGSSGVGKTCLAKELHSYIYGTEYDLVRIDCGEFQQKHENQKILGSPAGYVGHDDGAQLPNAMMKNPYTVVLFDEVEKAHPDLWDTFLRVFDEGILTDSRGNEISFRNAIIIMTTNLGNDKVVKEMTGAQVGFGGRLGMAHDTKVNPARALVEKETKEAIRKKFKPEFLNRIDKIVVFNHLLPDDFKKIAEIEMDVVESKMAKRGLTLNYDDDVINGLIHEGVDSVRGARGIAQVRRERIEDLLADRIISSKCPRGTLFELVYRNGQFEIEVRLPVKRNVKASE